jgi:hypothetical protein
LLELGWGLHRDVRQLMKDSWHQTRLPLGFTQEQQDCISVLRQQTNATARILWEDVPSTESWSPLLPLHTERVFLGGMGTAGMIEPTRLRWANGLLASRPLHEWKAEEVTVFCDRYNVGWIVSHSLKGTQFWRQQPLARFVTALPDGGSLFALRRRPTFFLQGQGRIVECDAQHLTLEDLQPENGQIILSLHHDERMHTTDQRIRLDRALFAESALPFLTLRLPGPVARVTIQW